MEPTSRLRGGSGRGHRSHWRLSAADQPLQLTCVGTTPSATGAVIIREEDESESWRENAVRLLFSKYYINASQNDHK